MNRHRLSRRAVLELGAAGAAFVTARPLVAAPKAKKLPIALQLWSIREECGKDMDAALAKVKEMGFDGVEFAGYHKYAKDAAGLRKRLDALGLKVAGTHIRADSFGPDKIKETIAFHKTIGCNLLIVPGDKRFTDAEGSKEYARLLTEAGAALKPEGLACGHHNHTHEFEKAPGGDKTWWDLFAERTSKDVVLQQDIGWTVVAGHDPIALIKRYPGRTRSAHIKAKLPKGTTGKKPIIGQDVADWKTIIATLRAHGGTEWLTVEQEDYPDGLSPMEATQASFTGLKKILG